MSPTLTGSAGQYHWAEDYRLLQSSVTFPDFPEFMI
jgi:hypothetical protein